MVGNKKENIKCLICESNNLHNYYYPNVLYNNKCFTYLECGDCGSAQIDPMPRHEDYEKMYGVSDHTYLNTLTESEKISFERSYPKYNHQKYQLDFFDKFGYNTKGKTLLDYGCGSGFYMHHASKQGLDCTGVEFNENFAKLMSGKTGLKIVSEKEIGGKKFDIIHAGHILEHLEDPLTGLEKLKGYAHANTLFVIDGPLEKNKCLSRFIIKTGSLLKGKKVNTYPPQHLTFTNYDSQLLLFKRAGLAIRYYEVKEQMFPLPETFKLTEPKRDVLFLIARLSVNISKLNKRWGNIFHYAGVLNTQL